MCRHGTHSDHARYRMCRSAVPPRQAPDSPQGHRLGGPSSMLLPAAFHPQEPPSGETPGSVGDPSRVKTFPVRRSIYPCNSPLHFLATEAQNTQNFLIIFCDTRRHIVDTEGIRYSSVSANTLVGRGHIQIHWIWIVSVFLWPVGFRRKSKAQAYP